jgi:hypothetical protein
VGTVTEQKYLWGKRHALLERIALSVLYHQKRERFFDVWDKTTKGVAIIGGSAALAKVAGDLGLAIAAALITVTSTAALVFGFADRSKRHSELARNFRTLEAEIVERGERDCSEKDLSRWEAKQRLIETSEPPALSVLVVLCQNELAIAAGHPDKVINMPGYKRLLAQYWDFSTSRL